ncbi:MAG: cytochrome c [Acidobacteriota bacterium]|nr:MAG: cytochrome c [Acidobacteriota bacterium]
MTLSASLFLRSDYAAPNREFIPEMVYSPAFATYSGNPHFTDGKTQQTFPEGTVARGHLPFAYGPTPEEALRAGAELSSPPTPDPESAPAAGRVIFESFCIPCHGSTGAGDGTVTQRGFPSPPSLKAEHARSLPDGQIFHIITWGQGNMPPYRTMLSPEERWEVIPYIRKLQQETETGN